MKAQFMRMGGCKTEQEFYNKFPNEATFFEAFPAARRMVPMAQNGFNMPPNIDIPPMGEGEEYWNAFGKKYDRNAPISERDINYEEFLADQADTERRVINFQAGHGKQNWTAKQLKKLAMNEREGVLPGALPYTAESMGVGTLPQVGPTIDISGFQEREVKATKVRGADKDLTVAELYERKTGKPWAYARKYDTDGTVQGNLALRKALLNGTYKKAVVPEAYLTHSNDDRMRPMKFGGSAQPIDPYKSYADPRDRTNDIAQWMYQGGGAKKTTQFDDTEVGQKRLSEVMNFIQSNNMRAMADEEAQQMYFQGGGPANNPYGYKPNTGIEQWGQAADSYRNPEAFGKFAQATTDLGKNSWMQTDTTGTMGMAAYGGSYLPLAKDGPTEETKDYEEYQNFQKWKATQGNKTVPANYQDVINTSIKAGAMPDFSRVDPTNVKYDNDIKNRWFSNKMRKGHFTGSMDFVKRTDQESGVNQPSQGSTGNPNIHQGINGPAYNPMGGVGKSLFHPFTDGYRGSGNQPQVNSNTNKFLNKESDQNVAPNMNYGNQNPKNEITGTTPSSFNPWQQPYGDNMQLPPEGYPGNNPKMNYMSGQLNTNTVPPVVGGTYAPQVIPQDWNSREGLYNQAGNSRIEEPGNYRKDARQQYRGGGQFNINDEVDMSHEELQQFLAMGGTVDFM